MRLNEILYIKKIKYYYTVYWLGNFITNSNFTKYSTVKRHIGSYSNYRFCKYTLLVINYLRFDCNYLVFDTG